MSKEQEQASVRNEWRVTGMDCASCAAKIRTAVERLPGVSTVELGVMSEKLKVTRDPGLTDTNTIEKTVRGLGYGIATATAQTPPLPKIADADHHDCCQGHDHDHGLDHTHDAAPSGAGGHDHLHDDPAERDLPWHQTAKGRLVLLTGSVLAAATLLEWVAGAELGKWAFTAACLIGLAPVAKRAWSALRAGSPFTIESLMTIAAIGALFINAAEEAALVVFLFAVGEVLEGVAAGKARAGIQALANLVPTTAILDENGETRTVAAADLVPGQVVLVRPGDRIPADGTVIEGTSGVDESPVTGESVPRARGPGEPVFAGSINTEAALRITVTKAAADNTISRIVKLVEEAEDARAPTERFIDRFSRWYMPAITAIAALVIVVPPLAFGGDWDTWVYRGLALLLIGCPCALVISVPASIASALSAGARRGLLMKGGAVIEAAAKVSHVAFDKTGTLTRGRPIVTDVHVFGTASERDLMATAAAVEAGSSHPLAVAILAKAETDGITIPSAQGAKAIPGKGVEAIVDGAPAWVSSPRHAVTAGVLDSDGMAQAASYEQQGKTAVAVFREGQMLGLIALRDEPREDAAEAVRALRALNVGSTILTGDNPRTAAAIAAGLGMEFRAEMMPEDKLTVIRELSGKGGVMMVGDGINDAPALKQADVGVAMGSGTDVALETADAAILRDRVTDVAAQIRLARGTMANIRQNVGLALGLKAVFLVTSVLGMTGLWVAIMADTGATVLVTLNALRLLAFDPTRDKP